jgi:hypothetical protein
MPTSHLALPRRTSLRAFVDGADWSSFRAAVSLHAHTSYSRETLSDLPAYTRQIPVIGQRLTRRLGGRRRSAEPTVDLTKGWWNPPASPRVVFESEAAQIDQRFGLDSMVSITDHDDIAAGIELQTLFAARRAPVSVEWTVPYAEGYFHLGVHHLPQNSAVEWLSRLSAFTGGRRGETIRDLLDALHRVGSLVVFNHPWWDLAAIGERLHALRLRQFIDAYQPWLHAVEINGYRSRAENSRVRLLASERRLPLVAGGDRHGLAPNALLNLTRASSFAEFVAEVRDGVSHVVVMPEYQLPVGFRVLACVRDVLASHRVPASGRQPWTHRVSCECDGEMRSLSSCWPRGGPLWIRSSVAAFIMLSSRPLRPLVGRALRGLDGPAPVWPMAILG